MLKNQTKILFFLLVIGLVFSSGCRGSQAQARAQDAPLPTETLVLLGSTPEKPVPFGYDIMLQEFVLRIDEIMRAEHTTLTNQEGESILAEGQEFLLIRVTNQCIKPGQDQCQLKPTDYQIQDAAGTSILAEDDLIGLDELLTDSEITSGSSLKGMLVFRVEKGASYPILSYLQHNGSWVYFSLAY